MVGRAGILGYPIHEDFLLRPEGAVTQSETVPKPTFYYRYIHTKDVGVVRSLEDKGNISVDVTSPASTRLHVVSDTLVTILTDSFLPLPFLAPTYRRGHARSLMHVSNMDNTHIKRPRKKLPSAGPRPKPSPRLLGCTLAKKWWKQTNAGAPHDEHGLHDPEPACYQPPGSFRFRSIPISRFRRIDRSCFDASYPYFSHPLLGLLNEFLFCNAEAL
ncbi:hypothetical protein F5Y05DRAFT_163895 [Hypoxylon sp. FL0543]|nr:hypothetical protein F5Y05DRAFT_163895 [Hypoxylon sp. FL0543]